MKGRHRVAVLNRIEALVVRREHLSETDLEAWQQVDDDLAYHQWNFGGVSVWPLPRAEGGVDPKWLRFLHGSFNTEVHPVEFPSLCVWVCPQRDAVRLVFEVLLLLCSVSLGLMLFTDLYANGSGPRRLLMLLPGLLLGLVGFALLSCDPSLQALREGLLKGVALLVAVGVVFGLWWVLKRRVVPP